MPIFFGLFVLLFIVVGIISSNQQKKRYAELRALADKFNLTFLESGFPISNPSSLFNLFGVDNSTPDFPFSADFLTFFPTFNRGSAQTIEPAMIGRDGDGNNWFLFDYRYTVSSGKSSTTYRYSIVIAQTPVMFPTMSLAPENVGFSVGKFFGMRELQVESEEFNKRFFIKTTDEKMSVDLLHPMAIEMFLRQPLFEWQTSGPFVMLHISSLATAAQYETMTNCIREFLATIPTYYRQDYGGTRIQ